MGACTAIFVQSRLSGGWHVWQGSTQNDEPPPAVASALHYGVFADRGAAFCMAHDIANGLPVEELGAERPRQATVKELIFAAVAAERERCAQVALTYFGAKDDYWCEGDALAEIIRKEPAE